MGAVLAATAAAATLAFEGADEPADGEESRRRQYKPYYYRLYHTSKLPIWKNKVLTIHARPMVYATVKRAHFHLPLSFLMATMVLTHGM